MLIDGIVKSIKRARYSSHLHVIYEIDGKEFSLHISNSPANDIELIFNTKRSDTDDDSHTTVSE